MPTTVLRPVCFAGSTLLQTADANATDSLIYISNAGKMFQKVLGA